MTKPNIKQFTAKIIEATLLLKNKFSDYEIMDKTKLDPIALTKIKELYEQIERKYDLPF